MFIVGNQVFIFIKYIMSQGVYELNINSMCNDHINLLQQTILEALSDPNNIVFVYIDNLTQKTPYASVVNKDVILNIDTSNRNVDCSMELSGKTLRLINLRTYTGTVELIEINILKLIQQIMDKNVASKIFVFHKITPTTTSCSRNASISFPIDFSIVFGEKHIETAPAIQEPEQLKSSVKSMREPFVDPISRILQRPPPQPPRSVANLLVPLGRGIKRKHHTKHKKRAHHKQTNKHHRYNHHKMY
jgi:hypothetical protein